MHIELTPQQTADQRRFRAFAREYIRPHADRYDQEQCIPNELIQAIAQHGLLGSIVPQARGGTGTDMITFGLLNEEVGRSCSSTRSLLTVHSMVTQTVHRWGSKQHKATWLPSLLSGECVGAFALTEPHVGSDAKSIETTATLQDDTFILNGHKRWITFGQVANLFLVFASVDNKPSAFLVEKASAGLAIQPIKNVLGTRASMLAELHFDNCRIPKANLIGGIGFGLSAIAASALDIGRYSVAWGSVGIIQACLDASRHYANTRQQFGVYLKEHQLISHMITDMATNAQAARLLCYQAGYLKDTGDPGTVMATWMAKYFASQAAYRAASDAVQIHGANGCSDAYPVERYLRDAKVMEIIEGSSQLQQLLIAQFAYQDHSYDQE